MSTKAWTAFVWISTVTAFSVLVSGGVTYVLFEINPEVVRSKVQIVALILPAIIAPTCCAMVLREKFKAQALAKENDRLAHIDELTGIPNRRSFFKQAARKVSLWLGGQKNVAFILCDIDEFKKFNDKFGHDTGDFVLIHVSSILNNVSPSDALVARLGGEEFIILCAFMDEEEAIKVVANIVQTVADTPLLYDKRSHRVTISAGVCYSPSMIDLSTAMSQADKAMYEAKTNGRNRFVITASRAKEDTRYQGALTPTGTRTVMARSSETGLVSTRLDQSREQAPSN